MEIQGLIIVHFISVCVSSRCRLLEIVISVKTYRSIYVFNNLFNEVFKVPIICFKFVTIAFVSIGFSMCLIQKVTLNHFPQYAPSS